MGSPTPVFETYKGRRGRGLDAVIRVSLYRGGTFMLNCAASAAFGNPEYVVFAFARREQIIALRPAGPDERALAYRLVAQSAGSHYVTAKGLFTALGIPVDVSRVWEAEAVRIEDGTIYLAFADAVEKPSEPRERRVPAPVEMV